MKNNIRIKPWWFLLVAIVIISTVSLGFKHAVKKPYYIPVDNTFKKIYPVVGAGIGLKDPKDIQKVPVVSHWENFTMKDGLPDDKVSAVKVDGDKVWCGTANGLALYENGHFKVFTTKDGLAHHGVISLDISKETGDLWIGTLAGLNKYSAGKFETYNQFNSGMPNDLVYSVSCNKNYVWVATGGGAGCLNTYTGEWKIFTEQNAPMHEPWTYSVYADQNMTYIAAWGGGVIEYNMNTNNFRDYTDPDGEMEIDLYPNDGVVHDITTATHLSNGILWVCTYFGVSRYNGTQWTGYFKDSSGLASDFCNWIRADGDVCWICTDDGLSSFNGKTWVTYRRNNEGSGGEVIITEGNHVQKLKSPTSLSNNFCWGIDFKGNEIWVGTSHGLCHGIINEGSTAESPEL